MASGLYPCFSAGERGGVGSCGGSSGCACGRWTCL